MAFTTTPTFAPGAITVLFDVTSYALARVARAPDGVGGGNRRYAVAPDGQRFLFLKAAPTTADGVSQEQLLFVERWFEELRQRVRVN